MAKPSMIGAAPAFKAVAYRAPVQSADARRAAAAENFPVPVYLVMRTDWRFSKRSGRHQQQTTTVVSAFTTQLPAQEAALIAFEKFVHEYHYAGERSVENRFSWYSWWNGRNKAHYRDVKEIAEDMKTWPSKWKGGKIEERYEKMVDAMEAVKARLPSGSVFNVEKASLPPAARTRAVNSPNPVPFRIFVLTENHWSWSKAVDVTTVLGIFTCLNQARAEGVDAYHAYIHSSHQERKRLKWDKTANNAYDRMLKNVLAEKVTWEKTSREYGTSFSIDECYCYPRGAYFRHQDEVLPKADEAVIFPKPGGDSSMRSGPSPSPAQPVEQVASAYDSGPVVQKENPYVPVVQSTDQDGPQAHGFIRRTYAVNPEKKKKEDRVGSQGIEAAAGVGLQRKGVLPPIRVAQPRGSGGDRARFQDRHRENAPEAAGGSIRFAASVRSNGSSRFAPRPATFDDDDDEEEEEEVQRRERHGEVQGDEDGAKRRKTWNDGRPKKDEEDLVGDRRGEDVALAWAQARARRGYAQDKDPGSDRDEVDPRSRENFEGREILQEDEIPAQSENIVYHRAYAYVARDKRREGVLDEPDASGYRQDEFTSEGERADDENSDHTTVHRGVHQRRWVEEQAGVAYTSSGNNVGEDDGEVGNCRPTEQSGQEDEGEALPEVIDDDGFPTAAEACEEEYLPEGDEYHPDHGPMEKSEGIDDEARSEVDDQLPDPITSEGCEEAQGIRGGHYNPFDDSSQKEKTGGEESCEMGGIRESHRKPFEDSFEKEKTEGEHENGCVEEVVEELEDPPLFRKPRKPDEKISKYLEDQLQCLFTGEGCDDQMHAEGCEYQPKGPSSVWNAGESKERHSTKDHEWTRRTCKNAGDGDEVHPKADNGEQEDRSQMHEAREVEEVVLEQVVDHRGYSCMSVGYEGVNYAEGDDPPLIRKSRERKDSRFKGDERHRGKAYRRGVYHHTNHPEYDFATGGYESISTAERSGPRPIGKSGESKGVRMEEDERQRREGSKRGAHHQTDHRDHGFTGGGYEGVNRDIPVSQKSREQKPGQSQGNDVVGAQASKKAAPEHSEVFADCEVDQLEDESVEEVVVGPRKEAPHLDLVLKRHRNHAFLKEDDDSSKEDFGGRRPVGGGFKVPS